LCAAYKRTHNNAPRMFCTLLFDDDADEN